MQKERICCTSVHFRQGETLPTSRLSQCDVTWVLRGPGPEAGPLTCSGPCSWPPSPQGTHSSQWGPWTWWTSPSGSPTTAKQNTPVILLYRKWLEGPRSHELFTLFLFSFLEVQKWKGHSLSLCRPNETNRGGFSNEILQLITRRLSHRYKWNMNMECENPLKIKALLILCLGVKE